MAGIISYFAVTDAEFWTGILLIAVATVILLLAIRPEREYSNLPRGTFPEGDEPQATRQVSGGEPPAREQVPQMRPAEAAFVVREAGPHDITLCYLLDLAMRGFIELVEYRYLSRGTPVVVIVYLRGPDATCSPEERMFLEHLAVPGSMENLPYARSHPFDARRFRGVLEGMGVPPVGTPSARLSGLRRSISDKFAGAVAHRIHEDYRWFRSGRERLSSAGALEFIGGLGAALVAAFLMLTSSLHSFWLIICVLVMLLGLATIWGAAVRTTNGTVASDQGRGFRRFLVSPAPGTDLAQLAQYGAWAVALDCVHEWGQSLERLSVVDDRPISELLPNIIRTSGPLTYWHEVADFIALMRARLHSAPESADTKPGQFTGYVGWQDMAPGGDR